MACGAEEPYHRGSQNSEGVIVMTEVYATPGSAATGTPAHAGASTFQPAACAGTPRPVPVSYTHLAVAKRHLGEALGFRLQEGEEA